MDDDQPFKFEDGTKLFFRTGDLTAFSKFVNAFKNTNKNKLIRMKYTAEGLIMSELAGRDQIFLYGSFKASSFRIFHCAQPDFFALDAEIFSAILSNHTQKDELQIAYVSSKNKSVLQVDILKPKMETQDVYSFTLTVFETFEAEKEMKECEDEHCAQMVFVPINPFRSFIHTVTHTDVGSGRMNILVNEERVVIQREPVGVLLNRAELTLITGNGLGAPQVRSIRENTVKKSFAIKYLMEVFKFLENCSQEHLVIYIKPGRYPLVMELSIGQIGVLRVFFQEWDCQEMI